MRNTQLSNSAANAQADALARRLDEGYLRIYSGIQPEDADQPLESNTLLAELRFAATSAFPAEEGVLTFNAISSDAAADATGTATWFRALESNGSTVVMDGSVGDEDDVEDYNLILPTTAIVENARISVTSFVHTVSKATSGL